MMKSSSSLWLLSIAFLFLTLPMSAAKADGTTPTNFNSRICTLAGHAKDGPEEILNLRPAFDCGADKLTKNTDMLWLIADIGDLQNGMDKPVLRFRAARQGSVLLHSIYPNGSAQTKRYDQADMVSQWRSPYAVALPLVSSDGQFPKTVLIGAANPWDPSNWNDIELIDAKDDLAMHQNSELISVLVAGLLFAPLLIDFMFFVFMRQRFIFYHSLMAVAILINHICWSGLIFNLFPSATLVDRSWIAFMALAVLAYGGCMLIRSLCDQDKLGKWGALSLQFMGWTTLITTTFVVVFANQLSLTGSLIFHAVYGVMALTAIGNLLRCAVKGDRMAMLQLLGLSGAAFIAICRVVRAMGWIGDLPIFDFGFYIAILAEALATSIVVGYRAMQMRRAHDDALLVKRGLEEIAYTDELTGIPNRRAFQSEFAEFAAREGKPDQVSAIAIIDIDNFKKVNDQYGHAAGDMVLMQVAAIIKNKCGQDDFFARFGGEEFILLMSGQTREEIACSAQSLVESCAACDFRSAEHDIGQVTISIGLSFLSNYAEPDLEASFRTADKALYEAKKSGRNQISYDSPDNLELAAA